MLRCILLVAIVVTAADTCDMYTCKPDSMTWGSGTCGYYNETSTTWYFKDTCDNGEECTVGGTTTGNYTCTALNPPPITIYPGDKCGTGYTCSNDANCKSGNVCLGKALNETCDTTSTYCAPTLYCDSDSTCQPMKSVGSNCTQTSECGMDMGCWFGDTPTPGTTGTCTLWLTLAPGTYVGSAADVAFCENYQTSTNATGTVCTGPVTMASTNPVKCTFGNATECESNAVVAGSAMNSTCVCAKNPLGTAYCNLQPSDSPYLKVLSLFKSWVNSSTYKKKCSDPERGMVSTCAMNYWKDYEEFQYRSLAASLYPELIDSPDCVVETVQYGYYNAKKAYDSAVAIAVAGLIALAI